MSHACSEPTIAAARFSLRVQHLKSVVANIRPNAEVDDALLNTRRITGLTFASSTNALNGNETPARTKPDNRASESSIADLLSSVSGVTAQPALDPECQSTPRPYHTLLTSSLDLSVVSVVRH